MQTDSEVSIWKTWFKQKTEEEKKHQNNTHTNMHTRARETLKWFCVQINLITFGNTNLLWFTYNPTDPITFPAKQRIKLIFNFQLFS